MRVYLVGVSCVGKTTTGELLAKHLGYEFVDFDTETKREFQMPLLALHNQYRSNDEYRWATRPLLERILRDHPSDVVIAMPPGGLFSQYKSLLDKEHPDVITVWLKDDAQNIFDRIVFTDDDDNVIEEPVINVDNADYYFCEVQADLEYYRYTHSKARLHFDVDGRSAEEAAVALADALEAYLADQASSAKSAKRKGARTTERSSGVIPAYTFRLRLCFYDLVCWREVRVPKDFTFHQLHWIIQDCTHWDNSHLYDFAYTSRGVKHNLSLPNPHTGGDPFEDYLFEPRGGFPEWRDSRDVPLQDVFVRANKVLYTYDYGDNWQVEVRKLDSKTPLPSSVPLCLAGEGDNPPEDVGGELGFIHLIEAKRIVEQYDGLEEDEEDFDADVTYDLWGFEHEFWEIEPFDRDEVNQRLNLRWGEG